MAAGVVIREATPEDAEQCGSILYEAFHGVATQSGFPDDFPSVEFATTVFTLMAGSPGHYGVVAERDGEIVGSNFLDERDEIRGVGPISVNPEVQGSGAGRNLMVAVIERGRGARGVRLLQDAHNPV
jgi:predicted N-acetyltransferase YhbS